MSNSPPAQEAPISLRASTALSMRSGPPQAAADVQPTATRADPGDEEWGAIAALTAGTLAVLLGAGWLLQRRQRLARRDADAAPTRPATPEPVEAPAAPDDVMAQVAAQFAQEAMAMAPQQAFPASLEPRRRQPSRLGVARRKRLIAGLMWVRTAAARAAILAAVAVVVFWAIETADLRAGDTGLTRPLLVVLLVAWAASWACGRLANLLHRSFFGRVHPRFDN